MAKDNYFLVNRSLLNHWLWIETPFSRGQAWIDLIGLANHSDKKTMHRGKLIECKRGDVNLSIDHLATRWGWSRGKTKRFLETLEDEQMIVLKTDSRKTVITVENYNIYQHVSEKTDSKRTADGKADGQQTDRQTVGQTDTTKEGKRRLKKVNNNIPPSVEEVRAYCQERKNNVNPEAFIDFYDSKGWYVGKNKMTDWRAAVRNWERSSRASKSTEEVKAKKYAEYKPDEKEPEKISDAEQAARVRQMRERLGGMF